MVYLGPWGKLIHEKNQKQKISWHCPFKGVGKLEGSERVAGSWYRQRGNIHGAGGRADCPYSFCLAQTISKPYPLQAFKLQE